MPTLRRPVLLASIAVLAILPASVGSHLPHPEASPGSTLALAANHAAHSPHFEASELVPLAPCSICLLLRQAQQSGSQQPSTSSLPTAGRPPIAAAPLLAQQASVWGARPPPLS